MRVLLLSMLLLINANLSAQTTLNGTVYLYKEKGNNTPLEGVNIKALSGGSQMTKKNGTYSLAFDNQVSIVELDVYKKGYEVINDEEIKSLDLNKKKLQHIYFDIEDNTLKRERAMFDAFRKQMKRERDLYISIISRGGVELEKLVTKLEKEAGKGLKDVEAIKGFVAERYGANLDLIKSMIPTLIRQNLDHKELKLKRLKDWILSGNVDSIRKIYNELDFKGDSIDLVKKRREILQTKEFYFSLIPQMIIDGEYTKAQKAYENCVLADPTDVNTIFLFAKYLQKQNQHNYSIELYERLLSHINQKDTLLIIKTLNNVGILMYDSDKFAMAKSYYKDAKYIAEQHAPTNPDFYNEILAKIYNNVGVVLSKEDSVAKAINHYEISLQLRKKTNKNALANESNIISTLNNLGISFTKINDTIAASKYFEKALHNSRALAERDRNYIADLAETLNNSASFFWRLGDTSKARTYYFEALEIFRELSTDNPEAYASDLAFVLENIGELLRHGLELNDARELYEEAVMIRQRLDHVNPDFFKPSLVACLNSLGLVYRDLNMLSKSKKMLNEALQLSRSLVLKSSIYEGELVRSLISLGIVLNDLIPADSVISIKEQEQYSAFQEALVISKRLAHKEPNIYNLYIDKCLNGLEYLAKESFQNATKIRANVGDHSESNHFYQERLGMFKNSLDGMMLQIDKEDDRLMQEVNVRSNQLRIEEMLELWKNTLLEKKDFKGALLVLELLANYSNTPHKRKERLIEIHQTSQLVAESYITECDRENSKFYFRMSLAAVKGIITTTLKTNDIKDLKFLNNVAWIALNAQEPDLAMECAKKVKHINSLYSSTQSYIAHSFLLTGKTKKAFKIYSDFKLGKVSGDKDHVLNILTDFRNLDCSGSIPNNKLAAFKKMEKFLMTN